MSGEKPEGHGREDKREITVKIGTPKGSLTASFEKTATVIEAEQFVIDTQHLDGGTDAFELFFDGKLLTPVQRPLVSFGIKDGSTLLLAATGSGV